jgi:hypothetical protein
VMFKLLVDFNEVHNDRVRGLQRSAEGRRALRAGDAVLVHDDGEEEALGLVESVDGNLVRVRVNWATFGPAGHLHLSPNGAWWIKTPAAREGEKHGIVADLRSSREGLIPDREAHSVEYA